jgi:hypothetical protein
MNRGMAISETSVADVLNFSPKAIRFFIDQGTACAGCSLARFCTLKDVVKIFGLDEELFIDELAKLKIQ